MAKKTCEKCGRTKEDTMFYTYKNGQKSELCKECTLMHVNVWEPETFVWLLEKYDVPWLPWEWDSLRDKAYAKNPQKKNDTTVFGKYLSKMKLKQWKEKGWADTDELQHQHDLAVAAESADARQLEEFYAQQYENGQITEAQYRTLTKANLQRERDIQTAAASNQPTNPAIGQDNMYDQSKYMAQQDIPDLSSDLTEEDKKYLVMKWGRYYTPQEWVQLETFYNQMMQSFDIQDADTRATLILICKNNLKMNQAIDQGDVQGYQKLARASDLLRKSAKFTAAQNKQKDNEFIDSVGQLVSYCQKNGGEIPRIDISVSRDIVDDIIKDLKRYTKSLVEEDPALKRQIEDYLKKLKNNEQQKKDKQQAKEQGLDEVPITDKDILAYNQEIERQREEDKNESFSTPGVEQKE